MFGFKHVQASQGGTFQAPTAATTSWSVRTGVNNRLCFKFSSCSMAWEGSTAHVCSIYSFHSERCLSGVTKPPLSCETVAVLLDLDHTVCLQMTMLTCCHIRIKWCLRMQRISDNTHDYQNRKYVYIIQHRIHLESLCRFEGYTLQPK